MNGNINMLTVSVDKWWETTDFCKTSQHLLWTLIKSLEKEVAVTLASNKKVDLTYYQTIDQFIGSIVKRFMFSTFCRFSTLKKNYD